MKESILGVDKNLIFRETFTSEDAVRKNGGVPTGVTFSNGGGAWTSSSSIDYKNSYSGTYTIRIVFSAFEAGLYRYPIVFTDGSTYSTIRIYDTTANFSTNGLGSPTIYVNGVASTSTTGAREIIVSGATIPQRPTMRIGNYAGANGMANSTYELVEIYKGTLTANEVKNLYEKRQNREIARGHKYGPNLLTGTFNNGSTIPLETFSSSISGTSVSVSGTNTTGNARCYFNIGPVTAGEVYRLTGTFTSTGTIATSIKTTNDNGGDVVFATGGMATNTFFNIATSANVGVFVIVVVGTGSFTATNIKLEKVNPSEILRVDARNGVISNKYSGQIYGGVVISNPEFTSDDWTKGTGWSYDSNDKTYNKTDASSYEWLTKSGLTVGKTYRVIVDVDVQFTGNTRILIGSSTTAYSATPASTGRQIITIDGVCSGGTPSVFFGGTSVTKYKVYRIYVFEIVPAVIPTSVNVVRSDGIYVMEFNGTSSKIDCGNYDSLVGNKTFVAWVNPYYFTTERVFSNGKFLVRLDEGSSKYRGNFQMYNNAVNNSEATTVTQGFIWTLLVITRTSTGVSSFYLNGVASVKTGTDDTPSAGTTNMYIGSSASTNYFIGKMSNVRIYDGILSTAEIAQIYQDEKALYNL